MEKIRTAILSFGMSGKVFHAPFIELHPGLEFVGAWERSKHELKDYYPNAKRYDALESVLSDNTIDLVVVNTPTYTHYEYAKLALQAGKHVVVEKAFTTTVAEAKELKALAEKFKLKLSVFQNRRWDSDFLTVQKVVNSGVLGDVIDVTFGFDRFSPELSYKTHKEEKGPGAGIVKDLGPHVIDQALHLFGYPESVFAKLAITRDKSEVDDYFKILLFYPTFTVQLRGGYFFKEPTPSYIVHGKKGSFLKTRADVQETQLLKGMKPNDPAYGIEPPEEFGKLHYEKDGQDVYEEVPAVPGDYKHYYEGVYQSLANDRQEPVTAEEGLRVMNIIEAAFQSDEEKRVIPLS
jgi:scyllo-inositol 2-dehydrogenase (NADP+)